VTVKNLAQNSSEIIPELPIHSFAEDSPDSQGSKYQNSFLELLSSLKSSNIIKRSGQYQFNRIHSVNSFGPYPRKSPGFNK